MKKNEDGSVELHIYVDKASVEVFSSNNTCLLYTSKWDCIRLPSGPDGENKTQVDNLLMGISNQTKQGDMAWQFLKKLCYETKTQQKIFQYRQGISPLKACLLYTSHRNWRHVRISAWLGNI